MSILSRIEKAVSLHRGEAQPKKRKRRVYRDQTTGKLMIAATHDVGSRAAKQARLADKIARKKERRRQKT